MLCKNCGKEIAEGSLFCSYCGNKVNPENTCPKCGNVYPEGSVFCNVCGQRLDLNKCCPSCGKPVQEDAVYCNHCGKRLDGKEHCSNCGEIFEGAFCPKCGTPVGENNVTRSNEKKKADKTKLNEKLNKIFGKTGASILLVGVVFALVFVFLIGFNLTADFSENKYLLGDILEELQVPNKLNMYYYFGDIYKDIDETLKATNVRELPMEYTSPALYFKAILGTVISAVSILSVVVLSGFAIFTLVKKLRGKETKHAEKLSIAAMLSYVLGATSLYALNYTKANVDVSYHNQKIFAHVQISMNSTTIAGIVLCSIALGLAFACYLLKNRSVYRKVKNLVPSAIGLLSLVFAVIVAAFATGGVFNLISKSTGEDFYPLSIISKQQTAGIYYLLPWAEQLQSDPNLDVTPYAILIVLTVLQFALMTLAIVSIIKQCSNLMRNEKKNCWVLNIALIAVAIAYLALSTTGKDGLLNLFDLQGENSWLDSTSFRISIAPSIIALVFAFLTLATSIVQKIIPTVLPKVEEKKEEKIEEVIA